ncbi:P-loop containing nucleoside triphosphate hydrolase protein [Trichoderma chlorosporum]
MSSSSAGNMSGQGLGSRLLLDKVDKLRELGISHLVPLPQMVVVGDQSAGKSSVLESLTGFQFPRSATLCTRHATEIVCRREPTESVVVSIIPHSPSPEREKLVKDFRRVTDKIASDDFPKIFEDAAKVMGIKLSEDDADGGSAFSLDVLKVEISGPDADHLTVIDVPGMFETATPGVTTDSDIDLVKNMVKRYIHESRTIILAVVPCNGDIANQKILRLAAEADPQGKRTLGVLTKPDLAIENATKAVVCDLVNGKRRDLHLGYCVIKNLGADDTSGSMASWAFQRSGVVSKGHTREFHHDDDKEQASSSDGGDSSNTSRDGPEGYSVAEDRSLLYDGKVQFKIPKLGEDELCDIVSDSYWCPEPEMGNMLHHLQGQYLKSRGYEIGTFSSEMLPCTFKEQGSKWRSVTLAHASNAILIVHHFIHRALRDCCPDAVVRMELWGFLLYGHDDPGSQNNHEGLLKRYARAMDHAEFLLDVEFQGRCMTYDPRLESILDELKLDSEKAADPVPNALPSGAPQADGDQDSEKLSKSSLEETRQAIHNVLESYYDIALRRFIDVVCQQVIDHFLLHSKNGPLEMLSDKVVLNMSAEQLELIAGEDMAVKEKRERLMKETEALTQALKILRG